MNVPVIKIRLYEVCLELLVIHWCPLYLCFLLKSQMPRKILDCYKFVFPHLHASNMQCTEFINSVSAVTLRTIQSWNLLYGILAVG